MSLSVYVGFCNIYIVAVSEKIVGLGWTGLLGWEEGLGEKEHMSLSSGP
jgi:hypothetical protein